MKALLALIKKLYGSKALQNAIGTRTNVITLPDKDTKRFITNELNIEEASDAAANKAFKDAEKLISEIPKMNDQEILTFTGNLQRLDNKLNPPSAPIIDIKTKKPVTGIEKLAEERGFPRGMEPDSPLGQLLQSSRKLDDEAKKLKQTEGGIPFQMGDVKGTASADELFDMITKNPYRSGGPLDPNVGIVRTAAREILRKRLDAGEIDIPDAAERDAIAKGYQGGVDPIEVFRKRFGEDALQDLDEIADDLNKARDYNQIGEILKRNKLFDIEPKKDYGFDEGSYTDAEMMELLKKSDVDPDDTGFKDGGRVGFSLGKLVGKGITKFLGKEKDLTKQTEKFREGPITSEFLENVDQDVIDTFISTRDTKGPGGYGIYKSFDEMPAGLKAAELISRVKTKNGDIDYEAAEAFIGKRLRGDETIDELIEMIATPQRIEKAGGGVAYLMGL